MTDPTDAAARAQARREDAARRVELAESDARAEAKDAQKLIDDFVVKARERGIAPVPLRAQLMSGGTAKTNLTGWYIKANQTVAIGTDGSYYILTVPGGFKQRLTGVSVEPALPSLTVSKGGRDGESGPLRDFLERALER